MLSSWRKRRAARRAARKQDWKENAIAELITPAQFLCPISHDLMKDPVTLSTGITYDRESIEAWLDAGNSTCPVTNQVLISLDTVPNHGVRKMIQDWCVENGSRGIERIPTPRVPISSQEVWQILSEVDAAKRQNDDRKCQELVSKIKASAKESERNKRRMAADGTGAVLSEAFDSFAKGDNIVYESADLLEEILSALMIILPTPDEEKNRNLSTLPSLKKIMWLMRFGSPSGRRNAALALKGILSSDQGKVDDVVKIEGALEAVVKLVKDPICPTTTKASLLALYHMLMPCEPTLSNQKAMATSLTDMGLMPVLLEMLVDADRSICEKALGVLDGICSHEEGRTKAYENALTVPVLVKKLLRVSDLATELSISVLLKLGKNDERRAGGVIVEALQVGAFQKLLLVLQIGSNEATKDKLTELLKLLNLYRNKVECIDSSDFKDLKRSS